MKKHLRKIFAFSILSVIVLTQNSCGGFFGIDITDQKSVDDNLRSKIEEVIGGPDVKVIEISLTAGGGGTFSKTLTSAYVYYFEPATGYVKCMFITLSGKVEGKENSLVGKYHDDDTGDPTVKPEDVLKLSEVDFSKIASNVNKAGEMVEKEGHEFSGIGTYDIIVNADPSKTTVKFDVESRQDAKTTTKGGRLATEISYLTFDFSADAEGNVILKEE